MEDKEKMILIRDTFKELAHITDELIKLDERKDSDKDIAEKVEGLIGRFLMKSISVQSLIK